jgi:hypothetical protein
VPLVLMGYANPMVRRGPEWFAEAAAAAGVDGVICVDIPPEEDDALGPALRAKGIAPIRLATPTTDAARLPQVLEGSEGFLYYVSVAGITGKQQAQIASIEENVARIKQSTDIAGRVGFGVRTPRTGRRHRQGGRRRGGRLGAGRNLRRVWRQAPAVLKNSPPLADAVTRRPSARGRRWACDAAIPPPATRKLDCSSLRFSQ